MKRAEFIISCICVFVLANCGVAAGTEKDSFDASVYGVAEISHFHSTPERFSGMTAAQRDGVVAAKIALTKFLTAIQSKDGKPRQYISKELAAKFPTKRQLAASLLDEETSIVAFLIEDFEISESNTEAKLRVAVISSSEGTMVITSKSAVLDEIGSDWKITKFE